MRARRSIFIFYIRRTIRAKNRADTRLRLFGFYLQRFSFISICNDRTSTQRSENHYRCSNTLFHQQFFHVHSHSLQKIEPFLSTMARTERPKRAAAVVAEKKINAVLKILKGSSKGNREVAKRKQAKSRPSRQLTSRSRSNDASKKSSKKMKSTFQVENTPDDISELTIPTILTSLSSESQSILSDSSGSSSERIWISSTTRARLEHNRRRAAREVNSDGPMILSRRTTFRISSSSVLSPNYSPITAIELRFTPVATVQV